MVTTPFNGLPSVKGDIWGWVVSWDLDGLTMRFSELSDALRAAGLDPSVAREKLPRDAFARAARRLTTGGIIRPIKDETDPVHLRFQLTREDQAGDELLYSREAVICLDKTTGEITSDVPEVTARAKAAFDAAMDLRTSGDVTSIVQRLFKREGANGADLFPVNKRGTYFVRKEQGAFLDKIGAFVSGVKGHFVRIPYASGEDAGDTQVKAIVTDGIEDLIRDLDASTAEFCSETSDRAMTAAAERIKMIKFKIDSYSTYLDDQKDQLQDALRDAVGRMRERYASPAPETQPAG